MPNLVALIFLTPSCYRCGTRCRTIDFNVMYWTSRVPQRSIILHEELINRLTNSSIFVCVLKISKKKQATLSLGIWSFVCPIALACLTSIKKPQKRFPVKRLVTIGLCFCCSCKHCYQVHLHLEVNRGPTDCQVSKIFCDTWYSTQHTACTH